MRGPKLNWLGRDFAGCVSGQDIGDVYFTVICNPRAGLSRNPHFKRGI